MLALIADLPEGVVGVEAHGKVTADDYEKVLILGDEVPNYTAGAVWKDLKLGLGHLRAWVTCAPVDGARFY